MFAHNKCAGAQLCADSKSTNPARHLFEAQESDVGRLRVLHVLEKALAALDGDQDEQDQGGEEAEHVGELHRRLHPEASS